MLTMTTFWLAVFGLLACAPRVLRRFGTTAAADTLLARMRARLIVPLGLAIASGHFSCSSNLLPAADSGEGKRTDLPAPPKPDFTVSPEHPRLWASAGTDLAAKVAADRSNVWRLVAAAADAAPPKPTPAQIAERMACSAALFRFGTLPGPKYKKSRADYGAQAVADLTAFDLSPDNYKFVFPHIIHLACAYDWANSLLTAEQKSQFIQSMGEFRTWIKTGGAKPNTSKIGYTLWWGHNPASGAIMLLDLAVYGDGGEDWVTDTWQNAWWANDPHKPNFYFHKQSFPLGSNREGLCYWGVYIDVPTLEFAKSAFAQATGNHDADDLNPNRYPYWLLWQTQPSVAKDRQLRPLPTTIYSPMGASAATCYEAIWYERLGIETGGPDATRAALARWLLDQSTGYGYGAAVSPIQGLIAYLLIGDPRVAGKSPAALDVPLSYNTTSEVFQRSGWTPDATIVYFGCAPYWTRVTPTNEFMLWSKGQPLICQRIRVYGHSYGPHVFRNMPTFWKDDRIYLAANVDAREDYVVRSSLTQNGNTWVGDATRLYSGLPGRPVDTAKLIRLARRSVTYEHPTVTVVDEIECDKSLVPHIAWNTPTEPQLSVDNGQLTVVLANGPASCTMSFSTDNWQLSTDNVLKIGGTTPDGVNHWVDGLDGKPMDVLGQPIATPALDNNFLKMSRDDQIKGGGHWRLQCVLPAGGGKLTTTITVK